MDVGTLRNHIKSVPFLNISCLFFFQELDVDKFVTHELKFEDINKAFDILIEGKSLRCVIWMDK